MLTPAQEHIIDSTAPAVAEHLDTITTRFYPLMFDRYPQVAPLFNQTHQQNGQQPRALARMVLAYVQLRASPEKAREALEIVVDKHVSLNIQPAHYPIVGECLLIAIGEVLGDAVTPPVADAWGTLYQELADLLIELESQRYDAFAAAPGGWRGTRQFRIADTYQESCVIRSFRLEPEDGGAVANHTPGQYIGVKLSIDGEPVYRHYSLSDVSDGHSYQISIKRESEGVASRYFHDRMSIGDTLELLPPAGNMTLEGETEPLMLISGGVGQTPLLPIAKQALQQGRQVMYLHAALDARHHAFAETLVTLQQQYPDNLNVVTIYEDDDNGDHKGRIDQSMLAEYLPSQQARCYFVGPHGFMASISKSLTALGVSKERCHFEHFGPEVSLEAA